MRIKDFRISSVIVGVITLWISSCQRDQTREIYAMDFNTLSTNTVIGDPLDIIVNGNSMLVNQFNGDKFLVWLSLDNGKLLKTDILKGNGEREMQGPLMVSSFSDSLLIFDKPRFRLYKSDFRCDSIIPYVNNLPFWVAKVFPLKNGNIVASKIPFGVENKEVADTRFALMRGDSVLSHFGKYPDFSNSDKNNDAEQLANFHQIRGFLELPNNRFAVMSSHVLSIYSASGNGYNLVKEMPVAPYEYDSRASTSTRSAMTTLQNGYSPGTREGLGYYNGNIYLPYQEAENADIIFLVYDLELNLIGKIKPSTPIITPFTIDGAGHIISLKEEENESKICVSKNSVSDI